MQGPCAEKCALIIIMTAKSIEIPKLPLYPSSDMSCLNAHSAIESLHILAVEQG